MNGVIPVCVPTTFSLLSYVKISTGWVGRHSRWRRSTLSYEGKPELSAQSPALRERGQLYGWLSRIFMAEPTEGEVASYRSGDGRLLLNALSGDRQLGPGAADMIRRLDRPGADAPLAVTLAGAYGRLFHGFGGRRSVPPYQSVHEGEAAVTHGPAWRRMCTLMAELGLAKPDGVAEPEDHVGLQLAVMAHLSERAARNAEAGDAAGWSGAMERRQQFLTDHLLAWVPGFCAGCIANDEDGFYAGAARILDALLAEERQDAGVPAVPSLATACNDNE